jgi:hypothetical protein
MPRRGLPFRIDQERYWAIMLPVFTFSTRFRSRTAALRRSLVAAFHLADQASVDELTARVERIEGLVTRLAQPASRS